MVKVFLTGILGALKKNQKITVVIAKVLKRLDRIDLALP